MAREFSFNDPDRPKWGSDDPMPGRSDPHAERIESAQLARQIHDQMRLSGTDEVVNTRRFDNSEEFADFGAIVSRDAVGRLRIDWARESDQPRDERGRYTYAVPEEG